MDYLKIKTPEASRHPEGHCRDSTFATHSA